MSLLWILVLAQAVVMLYAAHAVCRRVRWDRRRPSRDRIMAVRAATTFAVLALLLALVLYLGSDGRKFVVVRDAWHFGLLATALATGVAVRVLAGDGKRD